MTRSIRVLITLLMLPLLVLPVGAALALPPDPSLLLILIDGLRWDAVDAASTPNLHALEKAGVRGEMIPVWPSETNPNLSALATGLYPNHNGIVANEMQDPAIGRLFTQSTGDPRWFRGEPIWARVAKQGATSGVIGGWVGAGARLQEGANRPTFFLPYTAPEGSREARAALLLALLDQPAATRPRFLALHIADVDRNQHLHGVGSVEARRAIEQVDAQIGELIKGLRSRGLMDAVNVIVASDHGHMNVGVNQTIAIEDFIDLNDVDPTLLSGGPRVALWPKPGQADVLYERLLRAHPHLRVLHKQDLPARYHNGESPRWPPLVAVADPGWVVCGRHTDDECTMKGMHGYDNSLRDMHALLIASGPAIRAGVRIPLLENVNLYSLMEQILKLPPTQTDGSFDWCAVMVDPLPACSQPSARQQLLPLEQGSNFRDIGGYAAANGKHVRWGMIYRSGSTARLSERDVAYVRSLHLLSMFDLRSIEERQLAPTRLAEQGVQYVAMDYPFSALVPQADVAAAQATSSAYRKLPTALAPQYRAIFRALVSRRTPIAINCSAGQDRTGVAAALILSALGVPRETTLQDYLRSTELRHPENELPTVDLEKYPDNSLALLLIKREKTSPSRHGASPVPLYSPSGQPWLKETFDEIEKHWGSLESYFETVLDIGPADIEMLRATYLE